MLKPRFPFRNGALLAALAVAGFQTSLPVQHAAGGTLTIASSGAATVAGGATISNPINVRQTGGSTYVLPMGTFTAAGTFHALAAPTFSQFIIFGDSLSDVGNDADVSDAKYDVRFPGPGVYNESGEAATDYTDGRFTDGGDTDPAAVKYLGVWHEQLASMFLGVPVAKASLDGGTDYAFGGAITDSGQSTLSEEDGAVSINVDNMGRQVTNFLSANPTPDAAALYIVWGGANDLFTNNDATNVTNAAARETTLLQTLAEAGAKTFLVPNLPPLDLTPAYYGDAGMHQASIDFNTQLSTDLDNLIPALAGEGITGITIYRLDVYDLFQRLTTNKYAYGFVDIDDSSQIDTSGIDPDQYLFWDSVHPTTFGHFQLACEAFTLLTGVPVVEIYPEEAGKSGVYLTRTGADVSQKLVVDYKEVGTAISGVDYEALSGSKKLRPGKQTVAIDVVPTADATPGRTVKVKLKGETTYIRQPVVKKATVTLD